MYELLVAVDGNEDRARSAAATVEEFPGTDEIHVTLLNVFEEFSVSDADGGTVDSEDVYPVSDYPDSVRLVRDRLEEAGIGVDVRREHGEPSEEILSVGEEIGADHILVAGRKRSAVGKAIFGSVVQDVLLSADRPVTVAV